ncbi:MAG: hypothetical protein ACLFTE_07805 [Salinivenus sp.]
MNTIVDEVSGYAGTIAGTESVVDPESKVQSCSREGAGERVGAIVRVHISVERIDTYSNQHSIDQGPVVS